MALKYLVKKSSMESVPHAMTPIPQAHWAVQEYLSASGLHWTMVRPDFFMHNLLASAGVNRGPRLMMQPPIHHHVRVLHRPIENATP